MDAHPTRFETLLKKHWGYEAFRPFQRPIIESIYNGTDTLALLPTGGGKSITFQIAGLARGGLTLVITPLIALMDDQVLTLRNRGIRAAALHSASNASPQQTLNNCILGHFAFLYIAPERLLSELFQLYLPRLDVRLLVVDEAHCISQWGHDFRPAYRKIALLRPLLPAVPIIALTASATPTVRNDIKRQLHMEPCNEICAPFHRPNLIYGVRRHTAIPLAVQRMARRVPGCGIVYVRSRQSAEELAHLLGHEPGGATAYHAGLPARTRAKRQELWIQGQVRIIVATNAFGMGIDKPDTRFVIHTDFPASLEEYYQEAGRAGRDGLTAYAALFYNDSSLMRAQWAMTRRLHDYDLLRRLYRRLPAFLQIHPDEYDQFARPFHIDQFARYCHIPTERARSLLGVMQRHELLSLIPVEQDTLYLNLHSSFADQQAFRAGHPLHEQLLRHLCVATQHMHPGWNSHNIERISQRLDMPRHTLLNLLESAQRCGLLQWSLPTTNTNIILRANPSLSLPIARSTIELENHLTTHRCQAMLAYAQPSVPCRATHIAHYFGFEAEPCLRCDRCRAAQPPTR